MTQTTTQAAAAAQAAELLAEVLGGHLFAMSAGEHLTCSETDRLARALALLGKPDAAATLIYGHAAGDEEGDSHHELEEDEAPAYLTTLVDIVPAADQLPPIVYSDDAAESWFDQLASLYGWAVRLTLADGTKRDAAIRHASHDGLTLVWWDDVEPGPDSETVTLTLDDVRRIEVL